ncbi:hypothetical protein FSP39_019961 [Pinctada imbricata]|uniref:NADH dehydrogenase [ubiquinone] 1 alpha subcomplex subunit 12 n=1 Tax=Pinctada imbricata TaxID=66713 RepID=A0AA88XN65_PINIB|nr:hypothetical protein FSP39_019961 [Pinctada imbricata]
MKILFYSIDEIKEGRLVGEDDYGNKYYENNYYFFSSNRWVRYNPNVNMEYDGSQVPPEWHRWLHYITDEPPSTHPPELKKWMQPHKPNMSGTDKKYVPYSTTKPKVDVWQPSQGK